MRLIDADALFQEFEKSAWNDNNDRDDIAEELLLKSKTIDAVEVVRCKDCKKYRTEACAMDEFCNTKPDDYDFCSYGERNEY